jgi:hypothetical protein
MYDDEGEGGLTDEAANAIYDVLAQELELRDTPDNRYEFVYHQTKGFCSEFRVMGNLRFGGKFWRNSRRMEDGTFGEAWYVTCYREDETPEMRSIIERTNGRLDVLRKERIVTEKDAKVFAVVPRQDIVKVKEVVGWRNTKKEAEAFRTLVQSLPAYADADLDIVPIQENAMLDALLNTSLNKRIPRWKD